MFKFKKGDRVKCICPEDWEEELRGAGAVAETGSRVPFVIFDKFGKFAMLQDQLQMLKIKLENK